TWINCPTVSVLDRKREIVEWLSSLESYGNQQDKRHQDVRHRRVDGIGEWLLQTDQFLKWRDCEDGSVDATLLCSGGPGVGKTYLSSVVIDRLCDRSEGSSVSVAYIYCNFQTQKSQATAHMLGSLLKQVVCGLEVIPEEIGCAFQKAKQGQDGRGLTVSEFLKLLRATLKSRKRTFVCIDALDECATEYRPELFRSLHSLVRNSPNIRLF
ncbi:unnamed protein product, partial [Tuber aestivum]